MVITYQKDAKWDSSTLNWKLLSNMVDGTDFQIFIDTGNRGHIFLDFKQIWRASKQIFPSHKVHIINEPHQNNISPS